MITPSRIKKNRQIGCCVALILAFPLYTIAQNPFITNRYTADPTARVFNDTLFVYPSSDTVCNLIEENNGFCMHNYHVYSTTDLTHWTDHGHIVEQNSVPWVQKNSYGMWAPDCIRKDGRYYFYFPAIPADGSAFRRIGVAIAQQPTGPFVPEPDYIQGIGGIDPNIFIDDDGRTYLYFGGGEQLNVVELNEDLVSIKGQVAVVQGLPAGYKEGSFVFKRNGIYYFTFPHAPGASEEIAYAMGKSPLGPFEYQGVIIDRWTDGCWTNHHSIVEYRGQWYIFYHHFETSYSMTRRSICADKISFNPDGTIPKIHATKRGIGQISANQTIQADRYSLLLNAHTAPQHHEAFYNWVIKDITDSTRIRVDEIDFGQEDFAGVVAYVNAPTEGGNLQIRANDGVIASASLPKTHLYQWVAVYLPLTKKVKGLQNLEFTFENSSDDVQLDWIRFVPKGIAAIVKSYELEMDYQNVEFLSGQNNIRLTKPDMTSINELQCGEVSNDGRIEIRLNGETRNSSSPLKANDILDFSVIGKEHWFSAFDTIKASAYTNMNGISTEPCWSGGQNVAFIENGDYIEFNNLIFDRPARNIEVSVASERLGGSIEIRKDNIKGEVIATIDVPSTGGWQNWNSRHIELNTPVNENHKIVVMFNGGDGFLFNLDWIRFY